MRWHIHNRIHLLNLYLDYYFGEGSMRLPLSLAPSLLPWMRREIAEWICEVNILYVPASNDSRIVFHLRRVRRGLCVCTKLYTINCSYNTLCVCVCTTSSFRLNFSFFQFLVANECVTNKTWCERVTATPSAPWIDQHTHTQFASFHFASPQIERRPCNVCFCCTEKKFVQENEAKLRDKNKQTHTVSHTHIHSRSLHHLRCCWTTCALTRIRIHMRRHTQRIDAASPKYQNHRCSAAT